MKRLLEFFKKLRFRITAASTAVIPSIFMNKYNTKFIDSKCLKEPNKEMTLIQKIREDELFKLNATCIGYTNANNICYCSTENEPHYHNNIHVSALHKRDNIITIKDRTKLN